LACAAAAQPQQKGVRTRAKAREQAAEEGDAVSPPLVSLNVQNAETAGIGQQLAGTLRSLQQQLSEMQASAAAQLEQQNKFLVQQLDAIKRERASQAYRRNYDDPRLQFSEDLATWMEQEPERGAGGAGKGVLGAWESLGDFRRVGAETVLRQGGGLLGW
jgi:hypothetical protein